jgi:predicted aspartyl protease
VSININHRGKTLHLIVEVHNGLIKGLVDTCAFMLMMATTIVQELGIMYLVLGNESYKTAFGTIIRALGRITNIRVKVGNVQCSMVFIIVDIDSYDVLLDLDFLMKIGIMVDVEKGVI